MGENKCALGDHSEGTQTKDMIWGGGSLHDDQESDCGRPWDTSQPFIWHLCASRIGMQRNFKRNGMTVFDLVRAKVIVTN